MYTCATLSFKIKLNYDDFHYFHIFPFELSFLPSHLLSPSLLFTPNYFPPLLLIHHFCANLRSIIKYSNPQLINSQTYVKTFSKNTIITTTKSVNSLPLLRLSPANISDFHAINYLIYIQ